MECVPLLYNVFTWTYVASPNTPTVGKNILGAFVERFNPTTRTFVFTASPADAGKTYEVLFGSLFFAFAFFTFVFTECVR